MRIQIPYLYFPLLTLFSTGTATIDDNSNGLSDVWEQRFNASALELIADTDGDGFNNLEECIAGTDPYNSQDLPSLKPAYVQETADQMRLSFQTIRGKHYVIEHSIDLETFEAINQGWLGDGSIRDLEINKSGHAETISPIIAEFWANIPNNSIDALYNNSNYPTAPDGRIYAQQPAAPIFAASQYGARIHFWITPPEAGSYTFYLSSGGPAELHLIDETDTEEANNKIAETLPLQTGLNPGDWQTYGSQRSASIALSAESHYRMELRYVSVIPLQHAEIAWSGPGLDGIQALDRNDLSNINFHAETEPLSQLLKHDYDSAGQTDALWPANTTVISAPAGMLGNAEHVTGDTGSSNDERVFFSQPTSSHLYATWLFHMADTPQDVRLIFMNGSDSSQEGPRIDIEDRDSGTRAAVRAGGSSGSEQEIYVNFDTTYRVELVSTLSAEGFSYQTPTKQFTVEQDSFDIYVSDANRNLIGSATGLSFRDGPDVVEAFSSMRLLNPETPNISFDNWEITSGQILGSGFLIPNKIDFGDQATPNFFELQIQEQDQDADGIPDWEELALAANYPFLFFDAETINGTADETSLQNLLTGATGSIEVALYASDAAAFESNFPNTITDDGEIIITRTGPLTPVTVTLCVAPLEETGNTATVCDGSCCLLIGSAGDEEAEPEDYQLLDEEGQLITDTVHFEFGKMTKVLTLKAVNDTRNEYPETVNLAIATSTDNSYTLSDTQNGASIQLFDLPDSPDNLTIFTGTFSQDGAAVTGTSGSGFITATLNGPRTELRIWNEFSGLSSAQQDAHVHKSGIGPSPGPIIYEITETPGDPETDPLNGALTDYPWDINDSSGAVPTAGGSASKQTIIDSLFGQNGESPLYLNVHTVDNPAGEIWAFLNLSGGSAEDPGIPTPAAIAGSAEFPQLTGELLESEVRRFLNQATFGATDFEVDALVASIEQARNMDPDYHRNEAFAAWIDHQINNLDQTYLLEYTLAAHYQFMTLAHMFDPTLNPSQQGWDTPTPPAQWPSINRDDPNPEHWYLEDVYPINRDDLLLADANDIRAEPGRIQRRHSHWQLMLNAHDQLRQKMGYALQQIVVASDSLVTLRDTPYGTANYQDMLNTHAFNHYRDVLGFANWSPVMGKWLSSLQNQKAIDFDGDGLYDAFPDENLARENMQLFSIGLFEIWPDGSLKLSPEGLPSASYTNDDIREFAKVLTGQSFSKFNNPFLLQPWGGAPFVADNTTFSANQNGYNLTGVSYLYPLKMFGDYHSLGTKTFAGTTIDNTALNDPTAEGIADIEAAIDWLAGKPGDGQPDFDMVHSHVSTPAFISRRLIQRFTTSNPSTEYLHRVATVFKDNEGDLDDTIRAILLDPEARTLDLNNTTFGLKKSPLEGYLQLLRSLEALTYIPITDPAGAAPFDQALGDYTNSELYLDHFAYPADQIDNHERNLRFMPNTAITASNRGLQMDPFSQQTVFNYYLPDYSPSGAVSDAGLVAPELQLATEPDIMRNINYFEDIIRSSLGPSSNALGGSNNNQIIAFGNVDEAVNNDIPRLARQALADTFYPATEPADEFTTEATGTTVSTTGSNGVTAPHWLRLSRTGDVFITSESTDGLVWTEIATQVLPMASEVFIGLAVTSHDDGVLTTAEFSNISVTGTDGTWYSADIGDVAVIGSTTPNGVDSFELQASGNDIWSRDDECHFAYQLLTGDGTIEARVDSLELTHDSAKAGVMIRETLASDSANVLSLIRASNGTRAQMRAVPRGRSSESIADEALVDALDRRLTNGLFKLRYPYDTSDNDDPAIHGVDERFKNPREMIIDAITNAYGDPYDGSNDDTDRLSKFSDALYLLTFSPEYQIKK